ncbi:MAG: Coenzyme F420 hydrogenase/dehydrogenase, beta subunit C-terminal domain [Pelagibacteraceae bacterium]
MTNIKTLSDITNNGLCIGCGLCQSILGKEKISIEMTDKGRLEPREINQLSDEDLDKVKKICPGVIVEGLPKKEVNNDSKFDTLWGYYNSLFYAWSTDEQIRFQSSTGGLLNGLSLYLLESKKVDFILHTAGDPEQPMRSIPRFSYTKQELLSCESRSRYGPASPLSRFNEALDTKKNFAFVGKPCDISAIRQLSKTDERVNKQCKFLLTLVCGGSTEFTKSQDFIKSFNVKEEELETFRYRGFGNPGRMYIKTKDGREHDREYNSFWGEESTWRVHFRCKICPDAIGESADIAALDTWRGGSPKEEDEGYNAAIVRTQKGNDLLKEAIKAGYIQKGSNLTIADINDFQPHQVSKKKAVYARHLGMKKNNLPTITTNDLRIEELYNKNSNEFNKKEELGLSTRINKI